MASVTDRTEDRPTSRTNCGVASAVVALGFRLLCVVPSRRPEAGIQRLFPVSADRRRQRRMWRGQKGGVQAQNMTKYECGGSAPCGARPEGKKQRPGGDGRRPEKRGPSQPRRQRHATARTHKEALVF